MAMAANNNVVFTMKFDPADLAKLAAQITAALGGGGGSGGGAASPANPLTKSGSSNPSFMSIFKPLLALEFIKKALDTVVRNSSVANAYLGAMGKVFGAAMDLLLIPFLPIFNLLLVGLAKLVEFLSREDVQRFLEKIMNVISNIANWLVGKFNEYFPKFLEELSKIILKVQELVDEVKKFVQDNNLPGRAKEGYKDTKNFFENSPIVNNQITKTIMNGAISRIPGIGTIKDIVGGKNIIDSLLPNPVAGLPIPNPLSSVTKGAFNLTKDAWNMSGMQNQLPVWLQSNDKFEKYERDKKETTLIQQTPNVYITVHEATDGKKMAEIAREEMNKIGGAATRR